MPIVSDATTCWSISRTIMKASNVKTNEAAPAVTEKTPLLILLNMLSSVRSAQPQFRALVLSRAERTHIERGLRFFHMPARCSSQDDVERSRAAVTRMGRAHRGDMAGVP